MALHIADPEVTELVTHLATLEGTTKTEALRRMLRKTLADRQRDTKRAAFRDVAIRVGAEARNRNISPVAREEMDDLWGVSGFTDGH